MNTLRLKELREEKGESYRYAAIGTGLTEQTMRELEQGKMTNPTLKTLEKIAKHYNVPVSELVEEK